MKYFSFYIQMDYLAGFKPQLADLTLMWANGATFAEICKMSDTFEGSIIRCLRRLDELLKQLTDASKSIGNTVYFKYFIFQGIRTKIPSSKCKN